MGHSAWPPCAAALGRVFPRRLNLPEAFANGHRVHYELQGAVGAPVVVLSNSLGTTLAMWDDQVPSLIRQFRVLRYDTRGHGGSEVTPGDYQIEQLGTDVLDLTAVLGIDEFSFCGLSMGGLIGQWLALHAGKRLTSQRWSLPAPTTPSPPSQRDRPLQPAFREPSSR